MPRLVLNSTEPQLRLEGADRVGRFVEAGGLSPQLHFDIGSFKDELAAQNVIHRVARLGLPTSILKRRSLWKTSYVVLVGPYSNEEDETKIQNDLRSHGYNPRPFERGTRNFMFVSRLVLDGSRLPVGDLSISWESYFANAKVQFSGATVTARTNGTWVKCPHNYLRDEYVYETRSKTLLEIHFSGLNRALVFRKTGSPTCTAGSS
jgi:hypothetical protein